MTKVVQWMHGAAVGQSVYTFLYILDESMHKDSPVLNAHCTALMYLVFEVQEILRKCSCFREEDYAYSHVIEQLTKETPAQIDAKFAEAESFVLGMTAPKDLTEALLARIKFMRGFLAIFRQLDGDEFKPEGVQRTVGYCEKQLAKVLSTLGLGDPAAAKCVDQSVVYSFPVNVHLKKIPEYTKQAAYEKFQLLMKHYRVIIELHATKDLVDIWKILEEFMHDSPSMLARALFERCMFPVADHLYFGKVPLLDFNIVSIWHSSR